MAAGFGFSFSNLNPDLFEARNFKNSKGERLPYRFFQPKRSVSDQNKIPLLIHLHGAGERGTDNSVQLIHGLANLVKPENQAKYPCYIIVPQCPPQYRWVEVDWGLKSHKMPDSPSVPLRLTMELADEIIKKYNVDTNRIYITGLSMGGYGTWDAISRWNGKFAAAAPVCGGGDETQAAQLINIPIWAFHGAKDKVVPVIRSRNMIKSIRNAGGNPKYTEYKSVYHNSWDSAYNEPELLPWLFSQSKLIQTK